MKRLLSTFTGGGGLDIGFAGEFTCLKKSVNSVLHPNWIAKDMGDWVELAGTDFEVIFANDIWPDARAAWVSYFQQFGRLEQLTRWAAAIIINKILVYEDNRIKITFNFEADLNRIQEILSAAEEHKKEAI